MKNRAPVLAFGVLSYLLGVSALLGWISMMMGITVFPHEVSGGIGASLLSCLGLTAAFGVQHSIMARKSFKAWVSKFIPAAAERSLFLLATAVILWLALLFWPANDHLVWDVSNSSARIFLYAFAFFGWAYLLLASFAINHLELFGLEQVWRFFREQDPRTVPFSERWMYKFDRHPIMTGAILGMWAAPTMRMDHLLFASLFTLYIIVGVSIEERDLIQQWGESYLGYKKRTKSIVPTVRGG